MCGIAGIFGDKASSFIEALTINVPCVFYWDSDVYPMRPETEEYFKSLNDAEILFENPLNAARKVKEIFNDRTNWWLSNVTQAARVEFCERYGYARKDWLNIWADELKHVMHSKRGGC